MAERMATRPGEYALAAYRAGGKTAVPASAGDKRDVGAAARASAEAASKRARGQIVSQVSSNIPSGNPVAGVQEGARAPAGQGAEKEASDMDVADDEMFAPPFEPLSHSFRHLHRRPITVPFAPPSQPFHSHRHHCAYWHTQRHANFAS